MVEVEAAAPSLIRSKVISTFSVAGCHLEFQKSDIVYQRRIASVIVLKSMSGVVENAGKPLESRRNLLAFNFVPVRVWWPPS